jgi:hypothetical protein
VPVDGTGHVAFTTSALSTGTHVITAVYSGTLAASSSPAWTQTVAPYGTPNHLVFLTQPGNITAGQAIDSPGGVKMEVVDAFGNVVTGDHSAVSVSVASGPGLFASGTTSVTVSNGVAVFNNLVLDKAGTYTLRVTDGSLGGAVSNSFTVTVAQAVCFAVTIAPGNFTAGGSATLTVTALDPFGNVVTNYSGTVTFSSSDCEASLPPNATLVGGTGTFSVTLNTPGTQTVTATDTFNSGLTGNATVTVAAGCA